MSSTQDFGRAQAGVDGDAIREGAGPLRYATDVGGTNGPQPVQRRSSSMRLAFLGIVVFAGVFAGVVWGPGLLNEHALGTVAIFVAMAFAACVMLVCVYAATKQRRWIPILVGLAVALPVTGLTGLAMRHGYQLRETLLVHGLHAQGVVLGKRSVYGKYIHYYLKYRFDVPADNGGTDAWRVTDEDLVSYQVYNAATIGAVEPILYDPAKISHSMVETGERRPDVLPYIAICEAFFLMAFVLPFVSAWKAIDKKAAGRATAPEPEAQP
jgi:hypothetical protein